MPGLHLLPYKFLSHVYSFFVKYHLRKNLCEKKENDFKKAHWNVRMEETQKAKTQVNEKGFLSFNILNYAWQWK